MPYAAAKLNAADQIWGADFMRRAFSDPQLFAARRLLASSQSDVQALIERGRLQITCKADGTSHYGTVPLAKLTPRSRLLESSCSCGQAQPCAHVAAGYLLASADQRRVSADDVLVQLIGAGKEAAGALPATAPITDGSLTPDVRRWLEAFPVSGQADQSTLSPAQPTFVLEASELNGQLLNRVNGFVVEAGRRRHVPLAELASSQAVEAQLQRASALLLAAGVSNGGGWGADAAPALIALARAGRLRVAGDDRELTEGPAEDAQVDWEREGELMRPRVRTRHELRFVVDAEPPLYVDAQRRIGVLCGLSARAWHWLRSAPVVPLASTASFTAELISRPDVAAVLPPLPTVEVEDVPPGLFEAELELTGQGSTARAVLSFAYGDVIVTEPGLPTDYRQLVQGRWLVAHRDRARENACVQRLLEGGFRQEDGVTWKFFIEAHFADSTQGQWLRLQQTLLNDLEFDGAWRILVDPEFGFKRSIVAQKETAEATRRVNRRRLVR